MPPPPKPKTLEELQLLTNIKVFEAVQDVARQHNKTPEEVLAIVKDFLIHPSKHLQE